jgi:hypothetical protein
VRCPPGIGLGQHGAVDDGVLLEPIGDELLAPVGEPPGLEVVVQSDVQIEAARAARP